MQGLGGQPGRTAAGGLGFDVQGQVLAPQLNLPGRLEQSAPKIGEGILAEQIVQVRKWVPAEAVSGTGPAAPGVWNLGSQQGRLNSQSAAALGKNSVAPFDHLIALAIPLGAVILILAQAFHQGIPRLGVRQTGLAQGHPGPR